MANARQSVTLPDLMTSIKTILVAYTGLDPVYVKMWWGDEYRPYYEYENLVTYRLMQSTPQQYAGANRYGFPTDQILEVFAYCRYQVDQAGDDQYIGVNETYGFYPLMQKIINGFQGNDIFQNYDANAVPDPDNNTKYTICPVQMEEGVQPVRPKKENEKWIAGKVRFRLRLVQPLEVP